MNTRKYKMYVITGVTLKSTEYGTVNVISELVDMETSEKMNSTNSSNCPIILNTMCPSFEDGNYILVDKDGEREVFELNGIDPDISVRVDNLKDIRDNTVCSIRQKGWKKQQP